MWAHHQHILLPVIPSPGLRHHPRSSSGRTSAWLASCCTSTTTTASPRAKRNALSGPRTGAAKMQNEPNRQGSPQKLSRDVTATPPRRVGGGSFCVGLLHVQRVARRTRPDLTPSGLYNSPVDFDVAGPYAYPKRCGTTLVVLTNQGRGGITQPQAVGNQLQSEMCSLHQTHFARDLQPGHACQGRFLRACHSLVLFLSLLPPTS